MTLTKIDLPALAGLIAARAPAGATTVIGVTGSVAAGKSTLCAALAEALGPRRVETASTDGFLLPNATLAERDLLLRKGWPESYDADALIGAIAGVRTGPTVFPAYSHVTYDVDHAAGRVIDRPDLLLLEGLGFTAQPDARRPADALDVLVYLDAAEVDLETWFVARFMEFWRAAEHDPTSFYFQFRTMSEADADTFARSVWTRINLPNLREHIITARGHAHIVLRKDADHALWLAKA